nr:tyrosine protein kinase Fes:Fps [Hymenolepis microstoma]
MALIRLSCALERSNRRNSRDRLFHFLLSYGDSSPNLFFLWTMLLYLILCQLFVRVSAIVDVTVPVFSQYTMPCNITSLPTTLDLRKIMWYQDKRVNRAINEVILSRGEIPFGEITPDASGVYMCCYGNTSPVRCAEAIRLSVKYPRPKIFFDTILNTTTPVHIDTVYWLPQMLTTPLEHSNIAQSEASVSFHCYYYVKSTETRRPSVDWSFNDRLTAGKHFEKIIYENTPFHKIHRTEVPCKEGYMKGTGSHCFRSTLTVFVRKGNAKQRTTYYTCYVSMSNGYERNMLSVNYRLGNESPSIYNLSDMRYFNENCFKNLNSSTSLELAINQLNVCERNQFLNFWVSPAKDGNVVMACSRPQFVIFDEELQVMRLPADLGLIKKFAQLEVLRRFEEFDSNLYKYGERLLVSSRQRVRFQGQDLYFYYASIEGNLSLGCQSDQVVLICTYGPLFQMKLVSTGCESSGVFDKYLLYYTLGIGSPFIFVILIVDLWWYRRRKSCKEIVWKTVDSYISSYMIQSGLRTSSLPPQPLSSEKAKKKTCKPVFMRKKKCLKLDDTQWSPPSSQLRLEERIANGSYGDVFCGILLTPMDSGRKKGDGKMVEKQIVAKVLNDVFSKNNMMEFANEVATLRIIGVHPNIIQFMGCAKESNLGKQPVLMMEYASRGTLLNYLLLIPPDRNASISEITLNYWWTRTRWLIKDLFNFAIDIASALLYLENIAVSHGDIASRNVLLTSSFTAKLGDFGLACVIPHGKSTGLPHSKRIPVRWSAPEVILSNLRHVRSDVWSFGVFLWEIFSFGETPYAHIGSEEVVGTYVSIEGGRLCRPLINIDTDLYKLMTSCWNTSVEHRPSFQELLEGLKLIAKEAIESSAYSVFGLTDKKHSLQSYLPMDA